MNADGRGLKVAVNALNLPRHPAGISQYVRCLYARLAQSPEIAAVTLHIPAHAAEFFGGLHPKVRLRIYRIGSAIAGTLCSQALLPLRTRGDDLLHSVGNIAVLASRIPQLVTVHDLCHKTVPDRFGPVKRVYLTWGLALSTWMGRSRYVCVSENTLRDLIRFHPRAGGKAGVVHSAARFPVGRGGSPRGPRLLCVGTIEPGKNLMLAFRALALLKSRGRMAELDVVGASGWMQSGLPGELERLGVADQVRFARFVDEDTLLRMYRDAAGLIFPSRYEGFGFPILEAQSQGCPVLVADNSCMREIGGAGARYFRDDDAEDLADAIVRLLDEPDVTEGLVEEGYRNVARFGWDQTASGTLGAFRETVAALRN